MNAAYIFRRRAILVIFFLIVAFAFTATTAQHERKYKIAGKLTLTYVIKGKLEVGDTEGHLIGLAHATGTNISSASHPLMDGAQVRDSGFFDLGKEGATYHGYGHIFQGTDAVFTKYTGAGRFLSASGGQPYISFEGTFTFINGTGRFKGIEGAGTFKGKFDASGTTSTVDWEGEYSTRH